MLYESGRVVAIESDGLWVETLKQSACGSCAAKSGCGQKLLSEFSANSKFTLVKALFRNELSGEQWQVGDQVVLGINRHSLVKAALLSYLAPLLLMIAGVAITPIFLSQSEFQEATSAAGGLLGLLVGGFIVKTYSATIEGKSYYHPQVVGRTLSVEE